MADTGPSDPDVLKVMPIAELISGGFLQEINRLVLHPAGLALEVGTTSFPEIGTIRVWDSRDDPEGVAFAEGVLSQEKADRVEAEWRRHRTARWKLFGDVKPEEIGRVFRASRAQGIGEVAEQ